MGYITPPARGTVTVTDYTPAGTPNRLWWHPLHGSLAIFNYATAEWRPVGTVDPQSGQPGDNCYRAGKVSMDTSWFGAPHQNSVTIGSTEYTAGSFGVSIGDNVNGSGGTYHVLIGSGISAGHSADNTIGIGRDAQPLGSESIAIGNTANAGDVNAIAIGWFASSGMQNSIAIGESASAPEGYCVAIGSGATASGAESIAIGEGVTSSGPLSISIGYFGTNDADSGIAIGIDSNVGTLAVSGIAIGANSGVTHQKSLALGDGAASTVDYGAVLRYAELDIDPPTATASTIIISSPDGTRYRLGVTNAGVLTIVAA